MSHQNLVQYFNACYQADNRGQSLWDVFSKNNEFQVPLLSSDATSLIETEGVVTAAREQLTEDLYSAIATYRREKAFIFGRHFLIGKIPSSQSFSENSRVVCAPLLIYDASLGEVDSHYQYSVDVDSVRWNTNLLSELFDDKILLNSLDSALHEDPRLGLKSIVETISSQYQGSLLFETVDQPCDSLVLKQLKRRASAKTIRLLTGGITLLSKRSVSSRGIIDELSTIAEGKDLSAPLDMIFQRSITYYKGTKPCQIENVPGVLSRAQALSLNNAAYQPLSLLVGPPGTGKSYTIACMVLERFLRGESVLVVSENEAAVDVVQEKLVNSLGLSAGAVIRAGVKDYHKYLKQYIGDLTKGIGLESPGGSHKSRLKTAQRKTKVFERRFLKVSRQAVGDGVLLDELLNGSNKNSLINRFKLWRHSRRLSRYSNLFDLMDEVRSSQRKREKILADQINYIHLTALHKVLNRNRKQFLSFNSALRARTSQRQEAMFSQIDYSVLLQALPIWLCSLSSLHKALPLKSELFDLVIIDEATQCDLPSALPAFYRAKRAVVVGDPKQLSHISFLAGERQISLQKKFNVTSDSVDLDYRNRSVIDYASDAISGQDGVVMLDEHYRSAPEIIGFSNQCFYGGNLRIMTEKPVGNEEPALIVRQVDDGQRVKGVNRLEINTLVSELRSLIERQAAIPQEYKLSIGVLAFFRDQCDALQRTIFNEIELSDLNDHRIRVATPYGFQGEERDIMLISCGVGSTESAASYRYLNRADVFNVAVTRGRDLQLMFVSPAFDQLPKSSLLKQYIESATKLRTARKGTHQVRDNNIDDLSKALFSLGMKTIRNYSVAGISMDLVVQYEDYTMAIDLVGFPGEHEDVLHLEHYKIFERAGLTIFPLCYSSWIYSRDLVLEKLKACMHSLSSTNIEKLSIQQLSSHWTKLLAINPVVAKQVKTLEFELVNIQSRKGLEQLGQMIDAFQRVIWILNQKLSPTELTYSRYFGVSEQAMLGGIRHLEKIVNFEKVLPEEVDESMSQQGGGLIESLHERQESLVEQCHSEIALAIEALVKLAVQWSNVDTGGDGESFESTVSELQRLADKVDKYSI